MNILQRLILKQVWKQKKVWEGFIKCCQRTKPQSFQVLLQLPAPQLAEVFQECPDMKNPMRNHVMNFTENQVRLCFILEMQDFNMFVLLQRKHIPKKLMDVILSDKVVIIDDDSDYIPPAMPDLIVNIKKEPVDPSDPPPPGITAE